MYMCIHVYVCVLLVLSLIEVWLLLILVLRVVPEKYKLKDNSLNWFYGFWIPLHLKTVAPLFPVLNRLLVVCGRKWQRVIQFMNFISL